MAHATRTARARHRLSASARVMRYRYVTSWLVIMVCLDVFFLQGLVSSSSLEQEGHGAGIGSAPGRDVPGVGPPGRPRPHPPAGQPARPPAARPTRGPGGSGPLDDVRRVKRYRLACGVVTLAQTRAYARLVSVTPKPGCSVKSWRGAGWLRVDLAGVSPAGQRRLCRLVAGWRDRRLNVRYDNDAEVRDSPA